VAETVAVAEVSAATEVRSPSLLRRALVPSLKIVLTLAIAASMVYSVVHQWGQVRETWLGLAWQSVVLSFLFAVGGMLASVMAWKASLKDLEHDVPFVDAARINFVGSLGKYLPGSLWAYVMQMEFGRRAGLPRARALLASLVAVGLATTTGLVLGGLALPSLVSSTHATVTYGSSVRYTLYVLAVLAPISLVCAIPAVLTRLVQLFLRIVRRPALTQNLTWGGVLRVMGWALVAWVCFGVHLWLLANAQAAPGPVGVFKLVGAFAVAMTVGLFAVFAPSGLGVREAVLVAALLPLLGPTDGVGVALGIALASRMLFIVADVVMAGLAALAGMRADRLRAAAATASA
jgi:glycosyltransferase 2 family protein